MLVMSLIGCAVDASTEAASTSVEQDFEVHTVRTYHLGKKDDKGLPVFEEKTVRLKKIDSSLTGDGLAKARQELATSACAIPNQITTYLVVWHDTGLSGSYVCFTGTGDLDLTNVYYSNPFVCLWAPNYTACVNNLRVSGNVRSVWNGDDGTSECAFLGPNFSVYEFYQYPTAPYAISSAPANLINATLVSCF
jgi:hypothetical protein